MNLVYDQAFGAKTPTYSTVLQLDRKLRGFAVPASLQIAGFGNSESRAGQYYESVPLILQRHLVLAIRESSRCLTIIGCCFKSYISLRSAIHASRILRSGYQRPPKGPSRQSLRRLFYRCVPQRRVTGRPRAQHPLPAQGINGADVVPLDTSVLMFGKQVASGLIPGLRY